MFTERKMFSRSFESSAASGVDTRTTRSHTTSYNSCARSPQASVTPPTIFGVVRNVKSVRPGSTRSGENATLKSRPATSPDPSSNNGATRSRVVPG